MKRCYVCLRTAVVNLRILHINDICMFSFQSLCPFPVEMIRQELQKFPGAKGRLPKPPSQFLPS